MRLFSRGLLNVAAVCLLAHIAYCCQDGELFKILESCDEYDECIDGIQVRKRCKLGQHFDGQKCEDFWKVNCTKKTCTEGMIYQRGKCSIEYDVCQDGRLRTEICPAMYSFNGISCVPTENCLQGVKNSKKIDTNGEVSKCNEGEKLPKDGFSYRECINGNFVTKYCESGYNQLTQSCQTNNFLNLKGNDFCKEADRRPLPDCTKYQECVKGQYVIKQCPNSMLFDIKSIMCRFEWQATCAPDSCKNGLLTPDLNDCSFYYTCNKGVKVRTKCGWLKSFDPVHQQCTFTKNCERKTCGGDWTQLSNDCKQYTICRNGYQITYSCPPLQVYQDGSCGISNKCVHPNELINSNQATCINEATRRKFGTCKEYEKCKDNQWKTMRCPKNTNFQEDACEKKECPLMPVLNHCKEFMESISGRKLECPEGFAFDSIERQCVFEASARCAQGQCEGNEVTHHPTDCSKYKKCVNGEWITKSCPAVYTHFDDTLKECRFWHYTCAYDAANCTTGQSRPDSTDCKSYEQCVNNTWRTNKCSFWQHFDSRTNSCATFSYKCYQKPKTVEEEKILPVQLNELVLNDGYGKCVEGETEPILPTCRLYTQCINGQKVTKKCSPCQNFNVDEKKCDWVWKKPCKTGVTDPPLPTTTPKVTTKKPQPPPPKPQCFTENEKRGIKGDCHHYEECIQGKWVVEACSVWGKFDIITKECFYIQMSKVKCA